MISQIPAFLSARGIVFAKCPIQLREAVSEVLENWSENLIPEDAEPDCDVGSHRKDLKPEIAVTNYAVGQVASCDATYT